MGDSAWYNDPSHRDHLQLAERLYDVVDLLLIAPGLRESPALGTSAVSAQARLQVGLDLPSVASTCVGEDFVAQLLDFKTKFFFSLADEVQKSLSKMVDTSAKDMFAGLLGSLDTVFGADSSCRALSFTDDRIVQHLLEWQLPADLAKTLRDFAAEANDTCLASQVEFVFSTHAVLQRFAVCLKWWMASVTPGNAATTMDAQKASLTTVAYMKELRAQFAIYKRLSTSEEQARLQKVFGSGKGSVKALDSRFKADDLAYHICRSVQDFMGFVSETWTSHLTCLTEKITSWTIRIKDVDRNSTLSNDELIKALIGNPHYENLPAACDFLETLRKVLKPFCKDGTQLSAPVVACILKAAHGATQRGIECVAFTYGVFLVKHGLAMEKSLVKRIETVYGLLKKSSDQHIVLGTDLV